MVYATEIVQRYRLALQQLWNQHFWAYEQFRDSLSNADFDRLKLPLFTSLVARRLAPDLPFPQRLFGPEYKVVAPISWGADASIAMLTVNEGTAWKELQGPFAKVDLSLTMDDLFDWNVHSWRDFRYIRGTIETFSSRPDYVGREALVDIGYVDILWHTMQIQGAPGTYPPSLGV